MTFTVQRADERYFANHGWLKTYHSFSFADYYDPGNLQWGALRVFNDDCIAAGAGFPTHAHRDMEIVTYVFSGELEHQDSLGNRGVVGPGGVQFMSAGTGVRHSEFNASKERELHLVQMWILPGRTGTAPTYGQIDFKPSERENRWLTVASGRTGVPAPIALTQDAALRVSRLDDFGLQLAMQPERYGFLFVGDGAIVANDQALRAGDAVRMRDVARLDVSGSGEVVFWDVPGQSDASV